MKFQPTWQQVALLAVLIGAVITVHLVAPAAVSVVVSIVSTIVGFLIPSNEKVKESSTKDGAA